MYRFDRTRRLKLIKELLLLGFRFFAISRLLGINEDTARRDIASVRQQSNDASLSRRPPRDLYQRVMRRYIELRAQAKRNPIDEMLTTVLARWLGIDRVESYLVGVRRTVLAFAKPQVDPSDRGVEALLRLTYLPKKVGHSAPPRVRQLLTQFFEDVANGRQPLPRNEHQLRLELARPLTEWGRANVAPIWPVGMRAIVLHALQELTPDQLHALTVHYALDGGRYLGPPMSKAMWRKRHGCTRQNFQRVRDRALGILRRPVWRSRLAWLVIPTPANVSGTMQSFAELLDQLGQLQRVLARASAGAPVQLPGEPISEAILLQRLDGLTLSGRLMHRCQELDIVFLGELAQRQLLEMRSKRSGQQTIADVRLLLGSYGLEPGMVFDDVTRQKIARARRELTTDNQRSPRSTATRP